MRVLGGFPVALCRKLEARQRTRTAVLRPLMSAIYGVGGSGALLAARRSVARLLVQDLREGFAVFATLKVPVTPARLRVLDCMPGSLLVSALCRWAKFEKIIVRHTMARLSELRTLANEFREIIPFPGVATPAIDQLRAFLPAVAEPQHAAAA